MAVYILSTMLIIILAFAIYQLSKASEVEAEIKKLKKRDEVSLLAELTSAENVVWLCFTGGLLLTANYAITYFSGSELKNVPDWGFIQWSGAFMGLVIAVSITFVQKVLYSSPTHSKAGLVVTTLVLIFVIISEIGAPIEKEGMKMKEASQDSMVFRAVVGQIKGSTDATTSYSRQIADATAEKAQHEFELERCKRHEPKGEKRVKRCEDFENRAIAQAQAKIESYQASANSTTNSNESSRLALIQQAKALEHNTDNHSELVKLAALVLGADFQSAMMFLSLILIVAFEAGFHFVGSRVGVLKAALAEMGNKDILYEQQYKQMKKAKRFKDKSWNLKPTTESNTASSSGNKGYMPATALKSKAANSAANDLGFNATQPSNNIEKLGVKTGTMTAANENNTTSSKTPENKEHKNHANVDRHGVSGGSERVSTDRVGTVSPTVSARSNDGKNILGESSFNDLYQHVKTQVEEGKIKLSIRNMRKTAHRYIKDHATMKTASISMPETHYLVDKIRDRMIDENFIIDNPDYTNGKAKYLLKTRDKT